MSTSRVIKLNDSSKLMVIESRRSFRSNGHSSYPVKSKIFGGSSTNCISNNESHSINFTSRGGKDLKLQDYNFKSLKVPNLKKIPVKQQISNIKLPILKNSGYKVTHTKAPDLSKTEVKVKKIISRVDSKIHVGGNHHFELLTETDDIKDSKNHIEEIETNDNKGDITPEIIQPEKKESFVLRDFEKNPKFNTIKDDSLIKKDLEEIIKPLFNHNEFLKRIHHNTINKAYERSPLYKNLKDIVNQINNKKILNDKDASISSRLYLLNGNPIFEINNMISFPNFIQDSKIMTDLYHLNLFKLEKMCESYMKIKKQNDS